MGEGQLSIFSAFCVLLSNQLDVADNSENLKPFHNLIFLDGDLFVNTFPKRKISSQSGVSF